MINSINAVPVVQNATLSNPISNNPQVANPMPMLPTQNQNLYGINALASYNKPSCQQAKTPQPAIPTILQPEAIKTLKGERVLSSNGTLEAIVDKNDKTTVVYRMDVLAPNDAISEIKYIDNATGKPIRIQKNLNLIEQGKLPQTPYIEIKDFNSEGKIQKETLYQDGKVITTTDREYGANGYQKETISEGNRITVLEDFGDSNISKKTDYDAKGQIACVETINRKDFSKEVIFYKNGIPSKISNEKESPLQNLTGKNPLADPELIPAQPYIIGYDPKQVQGDRKTYSNGEIETIHTQTANGEVTHRFDVLGNLTGIEDASNPNQVKNIIFHDGEVGKRYYSIDEEISADVSKTTLFCEDGTKEVTVINRATHLEKSAMYSKEGILKNYIEYNKNNDENNIMMQFDDFGNLMRVS